MKNKRGDIVKVKELRELLNGITDDDMDICFSGTDCIIYDIVQVEVAKLTEDVGILLTTYK